MSVGTEPGVPGGLSPEAVEPHAELLEPEDERTADQIMDEAAALVAKNEIKPDEVSHFLEQAQRRDPTLTLKRFTDIMNARARLISPESVMDEPAGAAPQEQPTAVAPEITDRDREDERAETLTEEAAQVILSGQIEGSDDQLHQLHNQFLAEAGAPDVTFDQFVQGAMDRAQVLSQAPAETAAPAAEAPPEPVAAAPEIPAAPPVESTPTSEPSVTADQPTPTGQPFYARPGQTYSSFRDVAREGQVGGEAPVETQKPEPTRRTRPPRVRAEVTSPAAPVKPASPETPATATSGPSNVRYEIPKPASGKRERKGRFLRSTSAEDRTHAEQAYLDTIAALNATQNKLESKYKNLPKAKREERIRNDREMRPLLTQLDRIKEVLAAPVRQPKPERAPRAERPMPEPAVVAPQAERPTVPTEEGVLSLDDEDMLGGMSTPETQAAAARMAAQTPAGPARDQLIRAARGALAPAVETGVEETEEAPETPVTQPRQPRGRRLAPAGAEPSTPVAEPVEIPSNRATSADTEAEILEKLGKKLKTPSRAAAADGVPGGAGPFFIDRDRTARPTESQLPGGAGPFFVDRARETVAQTQETQPTTAPDARPEGVVETREREKLPHEIAVDDAREAYVRKLMNERRWFNFGNKKELDRTFRQYKAACDAALRIEHVAIKEKYPMGEQGLSETDRAVYLGELLGASIQYKQAEAVKLRDALSDPDRKDVVEKFRTAWRKNWKTRLGIGLAASATGVGFGLNMVFSQATWALNIEAAARGVGRWAGKKWGASQELSAEQIGQITSRAEIERRLAAHTFDVVEFGEQKAAKGKKYRVEGAETKAQTRTRDLLHARHGELLREEREAEMENMLREGKSVEEVAEHVVTASLQGGGLDDAYLNRIHRNKTFSKIRIGASVAGGALVGIAMHEATQHATKAVKEWFGGMMHHTDKAEHLRPGGKLGSLYSDSAKETTDSLAAGGHPTEVGAPVHKDWADLRMEESGYTPASPEPAAAIETAHRGDSVWSMAERYVERTHPELNPEQKTWMVDSIKDAVVKSPETFGLHDVNHVDLGQNIDFSKTALDMQHLAGQATKLSPETLSSIHENLHSAHQVVEAASGGVHTSADLIGPEVPADLPSTPAPEAGLIQKIPEGLDFTKAADQQFNFYRSAAMKLPDTSLDQLNQGLRGMSLETAQAVGPVEKLVDGLGTSAADRETLTTSIHGVARTLIQAGHAPNESVATGLEWIRVNRH